MITKLVILIEIVNLAVGAARRPPRFSRHECQAGYEYWEYTIPGKAYANVKIADIIAIDNDNAPLQLQCLERSGKPCKYEIGKQNQFKIGYTYFRYRATDRYGVSSFCIFRISVEDIEPPKFSNQHCQFGIRYTRSTLPGKNYATIKLDDIKVTDNSGVPTQISCSNSFKSGNFISCKYEFGKEYQFKIGSTDVRMHATDYSGLSDYCYFNIIVEDREPPRFWLHGDLLKEGHMQEYRKTILPGKDYAMIKFDGFKLSDNSGVSLKVDCLENGISCQYEFDKEYQFKIGKTYITFKATDSARRSTHIAFRVVVEAFCPPMKKTSQFVSVAHGNDCFTKKQKGGSRCMFQCAPGFSFEARSISECLRNGTWYPAKPPTCKDHEPPKFSKHQECQDTILYKKYTLSSKAYAIVKLDDIKVLDNSGATPQIDCLDQFGKPCKYDIGKEYQFGIGVTYFNLRATDQAGLSGRCRFRIFVVDTEPPKLIQCPSNIVKESTKQQERISWDEPKYSDNNGQPIEIIASYHRGSMFRVPGKIVIQYIARDRSGNVNKECIFTVQTKLKPVGCKVPTPTDNGAVVYHKGIALIVCRAGYGSMNQFLFCRNKEWTSPYPYPNKLSVIKFSDIQCKATSSTSPLRSWATYHGECNSTQGKQEILNLAQMVGFDKTYTVICGQKI